MDKKSFEINENYELKKSECIENFLLVLGIKEPYVMVHTDKSVFHINLVNLNYVDSISNLDILGESLISIEYDERPNRVFIKTDRHIVIIE